jgi:hypothetical protein
MNSGRQVQKKTPHKPGRQFTGTNQQPPTRGACLRPRFKVIYWTANLLGIKGDGLYTRLVLRDNRTGRVHRDVVCVLNGLIGVLNFAKPTVLPNIEDPLKEVISPGSRDLTLTQEDCRSIFCQLLDPLTQAFGHLSVSLAELVRAVGDNQLHITRRDNKKWGPDGTIWLASSQVIDKK